MKEQNNQARWIAVLAATGIALYLCWLMLRPFITVLEWAAVLVIVFYPVHKRLANKVKRRGLSALVSSVLVIVVLAITLGLLQTFKQENDEAQDMSAQRSSLPIDLSSRLSPSQDEMRTK